MFCRDEIYAAQSIYGVQQKTPQPLLTVLDLLQLHCESGASHERGIHWLNAVRLELSGYQLGARSKSRHHAVQIHGDARLVKHGWQAILSLAPSPNTEG
jgi:hypothetical protein